MGFGMIKLFVCLTLCSLSNAAYMSRMAISRVRSPSVFRPGVTLQRPWMQGPRIMAAASHRAPYLYYRNPPQKYRYSIKPMTRNVFTNPAWKTTARVPQPVAMVTPEYEFIRAASAPTNLRAETVSGAIHTIPAPNLSLSEKPIVVIDTSDNIPNDYATSEQPKQTYEVTERYPEQSVLPVPAKIEQPIGFSKTTSLTTPEFQSLVQNGAPLQVPSELDNPVTLSQPHMSQHHLSQHLSQPHLLSQHLSQPHLLSQQQHILSHPQNVLSQPHHAMPQQFTLQNFHNLPPQQELLNSGAEIIIPPNALYQPDPGFLQKLQNQFLNRYPAVEFIPYPADPSQMHLQPQIQAQPSQQIHVQASPPQQQLFLLENEIFKQPPSSFIPYEFQKNVVQRETQEGSVVTLVPEVKNVTEKEIRVEDSTAAASNPHNITLELITPVTDPSTTTSVKYIIETSTENLLEQKTTPIFYAQIGESVGNIVAKGFFSAINDVRAEAMLSQDEKRNETSTQNDKDNSTTTTTTSSTTSTTTVNPDIKTYFIQSAEKKNDSNTTVTELKPLLGVPFAKPADAVKVAYTLHRTDDKDTKVNKDGSIYAGQIVEATISEDHDFNNEKVGILSKRPPLRLFAVTEKKDTEAAAITSATPKVSFVKAKIPPKSKLTFDDKTGEPVLRIYASYVDSPLQKELLTSKLSNLKHVKEPITKKQDITDNTLQWKTSTVKALDKTHGTDANQVTSFGLKLRSRSDDYLPLFDEYN